ncbi:MAG TPA: CusA/CzcA family heavy metal efflux RND transporter [Candidatus Polarisedimenticolia bacterium]|nr:CusA/CzcA family heavy metal efflux RND transporter [Candidatus Polarisedimenticolia bacterium]
MINSIIDFCARNRFLVLLVTAAACLGGFFALRSVPLDALPDLSDTQVIVYSRWDRSPDIIEDQVTYPIVTALLGAPRVKDIRGFSDFGYSYVYIIFEDGTDIYWARSRTLEYLSKITPRLPAGVQTELGPDATGVGWVFEYALVDDSGRNSLADLRTYQDWYLRYWLQALPGVAEVASVGGFVRQYQVILDPDALRAYDVPISRVVEALRKSNNEVGGRLMEFAETEYMVRGRGYIRSIHDIEDIVVGTDGRGTPILVRQLGTVSLGPDMRRGLVELDGRGEAVGGIVVMRYGENALKVIDRVKARIKEIQPSLPPGMKIVTTYDRSELIQRSIRTLTHELRFEMIIVSIVILIFLLHLGSAAVPIVTLPIAVLLAFIPMHFMGLGSNIMSLGGIAVAIGAMVDAAIVVIENCHKRLETWEQEGRRGDYREALILAVKEVGGPSFYSLLVIAVSFMPVFTLAGQEGRLFRPLAYTKNLSMALAAVLAITLTPALLTLLIRREPFRFRPAGLRWIANTLLVGRIYSESEHPISRVLHRLYTPLVRFVIRYRKSVIVAAALLVLTTIPLYLRLGTEFMPPLNEGVILYMPTTLPGLPIDQATRLLQQQDRVLRTFPEVERVFGKAGRAETPTDPAPLSMFETTVVLKPERDWRPVRRFYSGWPAWLQAPFRPLWPDRIGWEDLINDMDRVLRYPGVSNAWTMPIKNRIDMLSTGIRTPIGIKILGPDTRTLERLGERIEAILRDLPATRSIYAERTAGGYFVDFDPRREELARYGLTIDDIQMVILSAIGGENVTTTVEGRERYPVNVRYGRERRQDLADLRAVVVPTPSGAQVPLGQLADIRLSQGPGMIRDENGMLSGYVYVDMDTRRRDIGSYVAEAKRAVAANLTMPPGYSLVWSGQYEYMQRARQRLAVMLPLTIFVIFLLLYLNTRSIVKTLLVFFAVPFSAVGAVWLLALLGYNMSVAVWVGIIALLGIDAETGVFMLLYLDLAYDERVRQGRMRTFDDLQDAILHGAVQRVRPKLMTVATTFVALLPIMWSAGTGADVMKRIAAPVVGGLFTSFLMELLVYPALYTVWKWRFELRRGTRVPDAAAVAAAPGTL